MPLTSVSTAEEEVLECCDSVKEELPELTFVADLTLEEETFKQESTGVTPVTTSAVNSGLGQ